MCWLSSIKSTNYRVLQLILNESLLPQRFWDKVNKESERGCWLWIGLKNHKGYGVFKIHGKYVSAHRLIYKTIIGPIPHGLQIDHLCRVRNCVNPAHMEPVTSRENSLRSMITQSYINANQTHCPQAHPYSGDNLYIEKSTGRRRCKICMNAALRRYRSSKKYKALSSKVKLLQQLPLDTE